MAIQGWGDNRQRHGLLTLGKISAEMASCFLTLASTWAAVFPKSKSWSTAVISFNQDSRSLAFLSNNKIRAGICEHTQKKIFSIGKRRRSISKFQMFSKMRALELEVKECLSAELTQSSKAKEELIVCLQLQQLLVSLVYAVKVSWGS